MICDIKKDLSLINLLYKNIILMYLLIIYRNLTQSFSIVNLYLENILKLRNLKLRGAKMRFKNYINPYTNDNRIYSKNEMLDMIIREIKVRKDEFIAQHQVLGSPDEKEFKNSSNVIWIEEYTRDDGTKVSGHWRSKPSEIDNNNSDYENTDWDENLEGAEELYSLQKYIESEEYKKEYRKREKQKSIERKDPEEIAGVKRGEPMSFDEADGGKVNPNYGKDNDCSENCASCVYAYESRRRGYNVEATPAVEGSVTKELGKNFFNSWLDIETGIPCNGIEIDVKNENCFDFFTENAMDGERYALVSYAEHDFEGNVDIEAHAITVEKDNNGDLIFYDPQSGGIRKNEIAKEYLDTWMGKNSRYNPRYLRIDNKKLSPTYYDKVLTKASVSSFYK